MIPGRGWKWRKQKEIKENRIKENCIKSLDVGLVLLFIYFILKATHAERLMALGLGLQNLLSLCSPEH